MEIKGKVHCFFEQSGTFKNEFKKLGYEAYDYDIQNNFNETDYQIDLFKEIESAYEGGGSIFDSITSDDLIIAFFPCIYFTGSQNPIYFKGCLPQWRDKPKDFIIKCILKRAMQREYFYELLLKLSSTIYKNNLRLIIENPYDDSMHFLKNNFISEPAIIDKNRMLRGDYFMKPTGYWFLNCSPTYGESFQNDKEQKIIRKCKSSKVVGLCSEERSMISPDYARNFICDFILGKKQDCLLQQRLF